MEFPNEAAAATEARNVLAEMASEGLRLEPPRPRPVTLFCSGFRL